MKSSRWKPALLALAVISGMATSGCRTTWVIVPHPASQYTATDTLYGISRGEEVRVTFRVDTLTRVDTVLRVDTAWVQGTRTLVRVDTLLRVDTVRVPAGDPRARVDTLLRVDTVRVPVNRTLVRTDTVLRVDTLRVVVTDTVIRTVRVPGRRMLFVPPGHHPPDGQCRVWIHDLPPGQQARAEECAALGAVPDGAFILFAGDAWDFDYDWLGEAEAKPGAVPPEIIALKRRK